jgi:inositol-pentakisphosphate 2-kinase
MSLTDTLPTDWSYISEGGANIVFAYKGPTNLLFDGTALRLRKCPLVGREKEQDSENEEFPTIEYQTKCLERLIPPAHLPRLWPIVMGVDTGAWLEALSTECESHRSLERREKDCIDVKRPRGLLATGLVGGQGIAVEIKVCSLFFSRSRTDLCSQNGVSYRLRHIFRMRRALSRPGHADSVCIRI